MRLTHLCVESSGATATTISFILEIFPKYGFKFSMLVETLHIHFLTKVNFSTFAIMSSNWTFIYSPRYITFTTSYAPIRIYSKLFDHKVVYRCLKLGGWAVLYLTMFLHEIESTDDDGNDCIRYTFIIANKRCNNRISFIVIIALNGSTDDNDL